MQNNKSCVYCNNPEVRRRAFFSDNLVSAFPTNIPIVPGHILITPQRCVQKFEDLTSPEKEAIFSVLEKVKKSLRATFNAEGFNFAWNEGSLAGQSVPHFHLHVLPRKKGDSGIIEYEPRKFLYRPGSREETPESELIDIAKKIKENMI